MADDESKHCDTLNTYPPILSDALYIYNIYI